MLRKYQLLLKRYTSIAVILLVLLGCSEPVILTVFRHKAERALKVLMAWRFENKIGNSSTGKIQSSTLQNQISSKMHAIRQDEKVNSALRIYTRKEDEHPPEYLTYPPSNFLENLCFSKSDEK